MKRIVASGLYRRNGIERRADGVSAFQYVIAKNLGAQ